MICLNKRESAAAITLAITLCILVALFGFIVNFSGSGGMHGGGAIGNGPRFAPYIYNQSIVDLSLSYIPPARTVTLYCTYMLTDSRNHVVDSSLMFHALFSDEYILTKSMSLPNDNYTFVISAHYVNGSICTPINSTIKVDTTILQPEMTLISPQAQNYATSKLDIVYSVNSPVEWSYYKLDNQEWVHFYGNATLSGLANGPHELQVSVKTEANEYSSNANMVRTINFNVNLTG
jgi:hypothetical protein